MLTCVLIDLERRRIRTIKWFGEYLLDQLDQAISAGDRETYSSDHLIRGKPVTIYCALGSTSERRHGWRFRAARDGLFFSSAAILPRESRDAPYSSFFDENCPVSCRDVLDSIEWFEASHNFSRILGEIPTPDQIDE